MNILNLLIKEKLTVGVEIDNLVVRVAYFHTKKKFIKKINTKDEEPEEELILIEEPIPINAILNGVVIDKELITRILRNIWKKEKLSNRYAIVSIPEDKIYSNLFPFPKTVDEVKLRQAVNLAIDFQLPFKKDDVYIGWENILKSNTINEVIISAIPKKIAEDYIKILKDAGVDVLALESHIASIARSIKLDQEGVALLTKENRDSITLFALKDNSFRFSRTIPSIIAKKDGCLDGEIIKIKNSFENEFKEKLVDLDLKNSTPKDEYQKYIKDSNKDGVSKWLISLGAAIRGEIPKGKDDQISLLPIGTNEAYKYQKIKTFITLIRNLTIGVSLFFLFAFIGAYLFIFSLSQSTKKASINIQVSPVSGDIAVKEELIQKVNSITLVSSTILSATPNWSILIEEINSRVISGITISNFSAPSLIDKISITGISTNRDTLNKFKKSLQDSTYLTQVELPITNLEQKADIPFSISFNVKDPSMLYYK